MNAAYGGLGCKNGGLFPRAQRLAEAITATGRAHITSVRKAMETEMWVNAAPDASHRFGIGPKPAEARHLAVIYGDTARITAPGDGFPRRAGAPDLLILASRGPSALRRAALGSVSAYVAAHAPCVLHSARLRSLPRLLWPRSLSALSLGRLSNTRSTRSADSEPHAIVCANK
jgi:hypothetical protein